MAKGAKWGTFFRVLCCSFIYLVRKKTQKKKSQQINTDKSIQRIIINKIAFIQIKLIQKEGFD